MINITGPSPAQKRKLMLIPVERVVIQIHLTLVIRTRRDRKPVDMNLFHNNVLRTYLFLHVETVGQRWFVHYLLMDNPVLGYVQFVLERKTMKIRAYLSHPIRGEKGKDTTLHDMELNNGIAMTVATALENALPCLELYVPARNDEIITDLYVRGGLKDGAILRADCNILEKRDILIEFKYQGVVSGGMQIEKNHAIEKGIPTFAFRKLSDIPALVDSILHWHYINNLK